MPHGNFNSLLSKIAATLSLTGEERDAVLALPLSIRNFKRREEIFRERDRPTQSCMIVSGYACRTKYLPDGRRQIMAFHLPGDIPDLQSLYLQNMDHNLSALDDVAVAFIPHHSLRRLLRQHENLMAYFWRESLIDASIFREWIVNIGCRDGVSRLAHLFCEQAQRSKAIGIGGENGFPMFLTQTIIADATGLTSVHVNRIMQTLRNSGLIVTTKDRLDIVDWRALAKVAEFDPAYLHQETQARDRGPTES